MHIDDSEITINVNLLDTFSGSGLSFCGMQGSDDLRKHRLTYNHVKGKAIIHLGTQRHGADNITDGKRLNLIVWCRSSEYRRTTGKNYQRSDYDVVPDKICLSRTHDEDYESWKNKFHILKVGD